MTNLSRAKKKKRIAALSTQLQSKKIVHVNIVLEHFARLLILVCTIYSYVFFASANTENYLYHFFFL